ncbi:MAG TPA: hypothetical protein VF273_07310, partial [Pelobium sp.]
TMTFKKQESILIVTHDLTLNRVFTSRYFSFISTLKAEGHNVKGIGIDFAFKPHPINNMDKVACPVAIESDIITIRPKKLNFVQQMLRFSDHKKLPFFLKKYLLALHIIIYRTDQWVVNVNDFAELKKYRPTIVIAGGSGGIAETAFKLAKQYGAKLFIDYRDPWNFGYHPMQTNKLITTFKKRFTINRELLLLSSADEIITVSTSLKSFFPNSFQKKITVIENGSDYEQEEALDVSLRRPKSYSIVYLGTLYDDQLVDDSFFESLRIFIKKTNLAPKDLSLSFLGSSENRQLPEILQKFGLTNFSRITTRLPKADLKLEIDAASLFLQLRHGGRTKVITSKQADYLMFRKPILLPNSDHGDIAQSIFEHSAGYVCDGKTETIISVLQKEYNKYLKGDDMRLAQTDLSHLSRKRLAEKLLAVI